MIKFEQKILNLVRDAYTKCAVIKARLTEPKEAKSPYICPYDSDAWCVVGVYACDVSDPEGAKKEFCAKCEGKYKQRKDGLKEA